MGKLSCFFAFVGRKKKDKVRIVQWVFTNIVSFVFPIFFLAVC